jgi:hypothetical protein
VAPLRHGSRARPRFRDLSRAGPPRREGVGRGSQAVNHSRRARPDPGRWRHLQPRGPGRERGRAGLGPGWPIPRGAVRPAGTRELRDPPPARHSPKKPCTIPSGWLSQSSPQGMSPRGRSRGRAAGAQLPPHKRGRSLSASSHARQTQATGLLASPRAAAAGTGVEELLAAGRRGARAPAFTSHNGGKQRLPTALPATWVELVREGRRERAARS